MRIKIIVLLLVVICGSVTIAQEADTTQNMNEIGNTQTIQETTADWYQGKPIRSITFSGLKNIGRSELDGVFKPYIGKAFADDIYWEILQKLYALEYFSDITPLALPADENRKTVNLQFTVVEKPVLKEIKFSGNDKMRTSELFDAVTMKTGDIFNELKSRLDERAIRDKYLEKGYSGVRVSSEYASNSDGSITLTFKIFEGQQNVISSIEFEGNKIISTRSLRGVLKLKPKKLLASGIFQESMLETDKESILTYYRERGYIDALIENVVREIETDTVKGKNTLKLTFLISEGEQYSYGGTTLEGNKVFSTEDLLAKIRIKKGDVLNLNKFQEGYQAIADTYFENGYTSNYINLQEDRNNDTKQVSYRLTVVESARSHIEKIIIRGNTKTKDAVVIREFSFETGDIFSKTKLIDSVRNLYNTRYFSIVSPDLAQGSEENLVDVVINLEEQSTASVQFGVTFSGVTDAESFPLSIFVQWEDSNFRGNGQTVSANLTGSPDTQALSLGFSENWFLGSPLTVSFDFSVTHKQLFTAQDSLYPIFSDADYDEYGPIPDPFYSYDDYRKSTSSDLYRMVYDRWEYSLGVSTGYRWFPSIAIITLRGGVNFSIVQNYYDAKLYRPADKIIRNEQRTLGWNNSVWSKISLDRRDLNYDPSSGWFASEQVTMYGLVPEIESDYFLRSDTKFEWYKTLVDLDVSNSWNFRLVFATYSGLSFLRPMYDNKISESRKLYIDGMFIGRGWNNLYSVPSARGNLQLNHWAELRIPLAPGIIAFDFFFDAVATKENLENITSLSLNDYYFSYGPSLRFSIPQFPLKLMFANTFKIIDGKYKAGGQNASDWKFVLSFNIANL